MEYLTVGFEAYLGAMPDLGELPENCFRGMASVFNGLIDGWVPTMIHPGAFTKTLQEGGRGVKILWQHDPTEPIGVPTYMAENESGLVIQSKISQTQRGTDALQLMRDGVLDALSIGFDPVKEDVTYDEKGNVVMRNIREVRLWEISCVTWGADPNAKIMQVHNRKYPVLGYIEQLAVTPFADFPLAERNQPWDATAALKGIKTWAGADEKPNTKYRRAFIWYDPANADNFDGYKLPIAEMHNSIVTAVPRAIFAAAASLQGSRGGVNIPDVDKEKAKGHLEKYYTKMAKEFNDDTIVAPWNANSLSCLQWYTVEDGLYLLGQKLIEGLTLDETCAVFKHIGVVEPLSALTIIDPENVLMDAEIAFAEMIAESV